MPTKSLTQAFDAETFRQLGHALVDKLATHLEKCHTPDGDMRVMTWQAPREKLKNWPTDFRAEPTSELEPFLDQLFHEAIQLHHPRFVGHQVSTPLPLASLLDFVADVLNNSMAVYEMGPAGTAIEINLVKWMGKQFGYDDSCGGVLTSGGTMGNLTALLAARQAKAGFDVWTQGIPNAKDFAFLVSEECHYSIARAVKIMGFGRDAIIPIASDGNFRMSVADLKSQFQKSKANGKRVLAVVASASSTATGAYDPLEDIGRFCQAENLWFHIDGAHGAAAILSDKYRELLKGAELADSLVWDAHKMSLMPALVTAVIFRKDEDSYKAFAQDAPYLLDEGDIRSFNQAERTLECTKRMMALKVYGSLKLLGTRVFAEHIDHSFDLARAFAKLIRETADFEVATEPQANIVCFRYLQEGRPAPDSVQAKIRERLVQDGRFYLVQTRLKQGLYLRVSLMNPLTTLADLAELLNQARLFTNP